MGTRLYVRYAVLVSLVIGTAFLLNAAIRSELSEEKLYRWRQSLKQSLRGPVQIQYIQPLEPKNEHAGLLEYARRRIEQPRDSSDLFELGLRLRALKAYLDSYPGATSSPFSARSGSSGVYAGTFEYLEREHFGWALKKHASLFALRSSFKGERAVVIPTGQQYFRFAVHIIRSIREVHRSSIPIQVYYLGKKDLNATHTEYLRTRYGVESIDITDVFDDDTLQLRGWDIKPFALLAAPFKEVLLMDADSVLMQPPEALFADPGYKSEGALFFHDRTLFPTDHYKQEWLVGMFPKPLSERLKTLRYYKMQTTYEQEAGVVVIDKARHYAAVLAVCRLNTPPEREKVIHEETHGDKETFWLGFELLGHPYSFMPHLPGSIGSVQVDFQDSSALAICGKLAHFDRNGTLLWFNDSIADNKRDEEWAAGVPEMTHWAREGTWTPYLCLHGPRTPLSETELGVISRLGAAYNPFPLANYTARSEK